MVNSRPKLLAWSRSSIVPFSLASREASTERLHHGYTQPERRPTVSTTTTRSLLLALAFFIVTTAFASAATSDKLLDPNGHAVDPFVASNAHAVVLFFAATDCPVSNRYVPEIQRLQKEFAASGVRFWFVYPNPADTAAVVRAHDAQFSITSPTAIDIAQTLVQRAHVTTTPEAAIFVPASSADAAAAGIMREVYRGRIDDRYLSFGHERPQAQHHDLEDAIRAVLTNHAVVPPGGGPVGCAIVPRRL
jgi:thiol-disulfide isomerase/thioredoxin